MNQAGDDEEPEISVAPMAQRPMPRRRSGLAEEPIEAGEITERRSLVVRSSSRVSVIDAPFVPPPVALPTAPPQPRRWVWLLVAVVFAGTGAALFAVRPRVAPVDTDMLAATAALVGTAIDGEARAVQVRTEAVATSSMLRAGIVTDAQTLADMARDKDVVFPVEDGETLEVLQVVDGKRTALLRVPADAPALEAPPAGKSVLAARLGDTLVVTTTASVASIEPKIGGYVVLSAPIDLAALRARLAGHVEEAVITGLALPIVLVKSTGLRGTVVSLPISASLVDNKLAFSAIVRPQAASSALPAIRLGAFGLAGLCVLFFLASLLRR